MTLKAVVFDRDGVLSDFDMAKARAHFDPLLPISVEALAGRWLAWGNAVGFPSTMAEETRFFRTFWMRISTELDLPDVARERLLATDYTKFLTPFADAHTAVEAIQARGLKIGVLSNFSLASLEHSLATLGFLPAVSAACAATAIGHPKPDPEAYHYICRQLGVHPSECLFFDDEPDCVAGAVAVGMTAYLVDRQQETAAVPYDYEVVHDLTAVDAILEKEAHESN